MTRDEAATLIRTAVVRWNDIEQKTAHQLSELEIDGWLKVFVAFGMLKLDEPKSVHDRAVDAIRAHKELYDVRPICVFDALDYAGLKIVEK